MVKLSLLFNIRKSVGTVYAGDSQEKLHSFLKGYKKAHCKSLYPFVNVFFSSQGNFSKTVQQLRRDGENTCNRSNEEQMQEACHDT